MKDFLKLCFVLSTALLITSCNKSSKNVSSLTGWKFNDSKYGGYIKGKSFKADPPPGMVAIEGGSFTMGQVQDDVMFDWNTTPRKMHVRSFYMDETEVTNSEYVLYLQNTKDVFPPSEEAYKHIYTSALPDTLVWRRTLGNTNLLTETYLRHPAYADYPVVGVSWIQANRYCSWRTNAVNLKRLMDKGVIDKKLFERDSLRTFFDTDVYLEDATALFDGDSTVYKRGLPVPKKSGNPKPAKGQFRGRHITPSDGILTQKFRLPTEVEWEYAAKATIENREYNTIRGRKKYAWDSKYTRDRSKRYKGDQLANFKQGKGEYSGLAGWSSDGSDIPIKVKSYPPNAFGLYDMSGNVSEWVADVYRPIIDSQANDFNYFRGNIFTKKVINEEGKVVIVNSIKYDTLENGKIIPKDIPGTVKYIPITKEDTYMRRNFNRANNANFNDGDLVSSNKYDSDNTNTTENVMYNSPIRSQEMDTVTGKYKSVYDSKKRTTLISDKTRVYKGGGWDDREYWLDPAQRRYLPEYMSSNSIGFRCATDMLGMPLSRKKRARKPSR